MGIKCFFQFEIIINVIVSSFCFIWIHIINMLLFGAWIKIRLCHLNLVLALKRLRPFYTPECGTLSVVLCKTELYTLPYFLLIHTISNEILKYRFYYFFASSVTRSSRPVYNKIIWCGHIVSKKYLYQITFVWLTTAIPGTWTLTKGFGAPCSYRFVRLLARCRVTIRLPGLR